MKKNTTLTKADDAKEADQTNKDEKFIPKEPVRVGDEFDDDSTLGCSCCLPR